MSSKLRGRTLVCDALAVVAVAGLIGSVFCPEDAERRPRGAGAGPVSPRSTRWFAGKFPGSPGSIWSMSNKLRCNNDFSVAAVAAVAGSASAEVVVVGSVEAGPVAVGVRVEGEAGAAVGAIAVGTRAA